MPLEFYFLRHSGWESSWVNCLRTSIGPSFLPIQEKDIQQGQLIKGKTLVAIGPTSCGKGLIGKLSSLDQIRHTRPRLIVVPMKTFAQQRYNQLLTRVWQDAVAEQQEDSAHKSEISQKIKREVRTTSKPLIRTIRKRELVLEV